MSEAPTGEPGSVKLLFILKSLSSLVFCVTNFGSLVKLFLRRTCVLQQFY